MVMMPPRAHEVQHAVTARTHHQGVDLMRRDEEGVRCGQRHGDCEDGGISARAERDVDRERDQKHRRPDVRHEQGEPRGERGQHALQHPDGNIAEQPERLLRDPRRRSGGLDRKAQRKQPREQEHALPPDRAICLVDGDDTAQDHPHRAGEQGEREPQIGEDGQADREQEERQRMVHPVRAGDLVGIVRHHDEQAVLGETVEVVPVAVQHQRIAHVKRGLREIVAEDFFLPVDREHVGSVAPSHSHFGDGAPDNVRGRRYDDLRHPCP